MTRRRELVPAILAFLAFIVGVIASPYFLDFRYLLDASSLYTETGLLALGMTLVIVSGNIDLSVASILALVACAAAKMLNAGWPLVLALGGGLTLGTVLGWLNGVLIAKLKLPSFAVTLATMAAYRGLAQVLVGSTSEKVPSSLTGIDTVHFFAKLVPLPLILLILVALAIGVLLHRIVLGRWIYTIGTNQRAALFSGVPTERVTAGVFAMSGLIAGFAGLLMASRLGVARYDHGRGLEVDAITAVVLGGASIYGGSGSILGTMLALLLVSLLRIGMGLANVTAEYQLAAIGSLLVVSVVVANVVGRPRIANSE